MKQERPHDKRITALGMAHCFVNCGPQGGCGLRRYATESVAGTDNPQWPVFRCASVQVYADGYELFE